MTGFNNNGKFAPSTPKTYTVSELRDTQQPVKKSNLSVAARNKVVNRSGSNYLSEKEGYGPCYYSNPDCTCYTSSGWIQLYLSCPAVGCTNKDAYSWVHSTDNYPIYISKDLDIKCVGCNNPSHMLNWRFNCYSTKHPGGYRETNYTIFLNALSLVGNDVRNRDPRIREIVKIITNKLFDA